MESKWIKQGVVLLWPPVIGALLLAIIPSFVQIPLVALVVLSFVILWTSFAVSWWPQFRERHSRVADGIPFAGVTAVCMLWLFAGYLWLRALPDSSAATTPREHSEIAPYVIGDLRDLLTRGEELQESWQRKSVAIFRPELFAVKDGWKDTLRWFNDVRAIVGQHWPEFKDKIATEDRLETLRTFGTAESLKEVQREIVRVNNLIRQSLGFPPATNVPKPFYAPPGAPRAFP